MNRGKFRVLFELLEPRLLLSATPASVSSATAFAASPTRIWYVSTYADPLEDGSAQHPFSKIQKAINAASAGDEVLVSAGSYFENINFQGKNLRLQSTDPANVSVVTSTVIDGYHNTPSAYQPVVTFSGTETAACVLEGLTLVHGSSGVLGNRCLATIEDNRILNNGYGDGNGGGINGCNGLIQNNTIDGNEPEFGSGGGLYNCNGTIQGNVITSNTALYGGGLDSCNGTIANNTISGNAADGGGGLSHCAGLIKGNVIQANTATMGGGIFACAGTISGNAIAENVANDGSGIYVGPAEGSPSYAGLSPTITNCAFFGNLTGDGAYVGTNCAPTFLNCTFNDNSTYGGSQYGMRFYKSSATVTNCIVWDLVATSGSAHPTFRYSDVFDCSGSGGSWNSLLGSDGGGNLDVDPQFVSGDDGAGDDGSYLTVDDGLSLMPQSPCIDAANGTLAPTTDILGRTRHDDPSVANTGSGNPGYADMGAYEYVILVNLQLVPVLQPTVDHDGTPNTVATLPQAASQIPLGSTYYLEAWAKDTSDVPTGISSGCFSVSYDSAMVGVLNLDHGGLYNTGTSGDVYDSGIYPFNQTGNLIQNNLIWVGKYSVGGPYLPVDKQAILFTDATTSQNRLITANISNNILVTCSGETFRMDPSTSASGSTIQNNLIYRTDGVDSVLLTGGKTYGWSGFQSYSATFSGNSRANPQFTNVSYDYYATPQNFNFQHPATPGFGPTGNLLQRSVTMIDTDGDGYGVNSTLGPDADPNDAAVHTWEQALAKWGTVQAFVNHLGYYPKHIYMGDPGSGVTLKPGDMVIFTSNITSSHGYVSDFVNGTASDPIIFLAQPGKDIKIAPQGNALDITNSSYEIWDGFNLDGSQSPTALGINMYYCQNVTFKNLNVHGWMVGMQAAQDLQNITVANCAFHDSAGSHGLYLESRDLPDSNLYVHDNLFFNNKNGLQMNGRVANLDIENNIFHNNWLAGISWLEGVHDSTIKNNLIFNNGTQGIVINAYDDDGAVQEFGGSCSTPATPASDYVLLGRIELRSTNRGIVTFFPDITSEDFSFFSGGTAPQETVEADAVSVRQYEGLLGDFNLDGKVNDADYTVWADYYHRTPPPAYQYGGDPSGGYNDADYTCWADNYSRPATQLPGDFNLDGTVDDADFKALTNYYCKTPPPTYERGSDLSGGYDDSDYTIWADNYSLTVAQFASAYRASAADIDGRASGAEADEAILAASPAFLAQSEESVSDMLTFVAGRALDVLSAPANCQVPVALDSMPNESDDLVDTPLVPEMDPGL